MAIDKKYVELIRADKYDRHEKGEQAPTERPNLREAYWRWPGSDLSKFAIQVTRKRLLGIQESKGLETP